MNLQGVYSKTAEGAQEITTRALHLDAMTRRLLIIVDGERSAEELMQFFKEGQDISVLFETLIQLGLIERTGGPITEMAPDSVQPPLTKPGNMGNKAGPNTTTVISELQSTDLPSPPVTRQPDANPGFIDLPRAESHHAGTHRFANAQSYMETTARKILGLKGVFFISKIERATSESELIALLDQFQSELYDGVKDRGAAKQHREKAESFLKK